MIICHWYAPPHVIPLVEVVKSEQAPQEYADIAVTMLNNCGKTAVLMKKFIRGYIVNRLQQCLNQEVFYLLDNGYCDAEAIDLAAKASFIPRACVLGLCKRMDFGGVDMTYNNFKNVFDKGAIEGKSSVWMRCVISMVSFVDGLKEQNSKIPADIEARQEYLKIVRPMANYPGMPDEIQDIWDNYCKQHDKVWRNEFVSSIKAEDMKSMLSKVTTAPERLVSECGAPNLAHIFLNTHHLLLFAQNLEVADVDILTRTYTLDEQYLCYLSKSINWLHWTGAWGNHRVEAYCSYFHPFIDDLFGNIESAIEGKNPYVANLRFTHDSYIMPLLTVLGYKDSALQYYGEGVAAWEKGATSAALSPLVPMAANLQIVLYRNKKGEVLVRSLLNENDIFLPIECETAPFYKWEDVKKYLNDRCASFRK